MAEVNQELFERAARGDREAFWRLVLPYRGLIYSVALSMLKNRERAEDQLHDVLLTAFGALPNLRRPDRLASWLFSLTRNRVLDLMRREERLRGVIFDRAVGAAPVVPMTELAEKEAWLSTMEEALDHLPEPFRLILAMKYMNEYGCREIAEILDISVPAVKSRLFEARKLLRKTTESLAVKKERGQL
jgi:RNA polymerase sigma factor (sigma-70 family)